MKPENPAGESMRTAPLPENLFREPIDFLIADHARIRTVCNGIECLKRGDSRPYESDVAARCVEFLERDLINHFRDEEEDLAPHLRQQWPVGDRDQLERNLHALVHQHRHDHFLSLRTLPLLPQIAAGAGQSEKELAVYAVSLIASLRRNLAWEEEAILRPARSHLSEADLAILGRRMSTRRGVGYPEFD